MPPVPISPNQFPRTIYGIHDLEGAGFLAQNQCSGWLVHTVKVGSDAPTDYSPFVNQNLRVIVRLNNGYGSEGTIPVPALYDQFAQRCANYVAASRGAQIWLIGNEMNASFEWPDNQPITAAQYASCFLKCRTAIHNVPGHANDQVIPGAVGPWNPSSGNWVQYFKDILNSLQGNCDGIALHTYGRGTTPDSITDESRYDQPGFEGLHKSFRTYQDFMNAIPAGMRGLPVYITETQTMDGDQPSWIHSNTGWVQTAFQEINNWNQNTSHQPIQALVLFRWNPGDPRWEFGRNEEIKTDFRAAIARNYQVVLPHTVAPPGPTLEQAARAKAQSVPWMPVNNGAALWRFAKANGLQDQQTDELPFTYNGEQYIVQVFNLGIVYVKVGDWGNIKVIRK